MQLLSKKIRTLTWRIWSRCVYGWRFDSFGKKSVLGRPLLLTGAKGIRIGNEVEVRSGARLEAIGLNREPKIFIGDRTIIHNGFHCGAASLVDIGREVLIAGRVFVSDHDHKFDNVELPPSKNGRLEVSPVKIEDGVWIGEGAAILKGVTIGQRAVVGANAVVTKDVLPFTVVGGIPAKTIRKVRTSKD